MRLLLNNLVEDSGNAITLEVCLEFHVNFVC